MFGNRARKKKENSQPVRVSLTFSFFGDLWDNFATKEKETVGRREDEERETSTSFLSFFFLVRGMVVVEGRGSRFRLFRFGLFSVFFSSVSVFAFAAGNN